MIKNSSSASGDAPRRNSESATTLQSISYAENISWHAFQGKFEIKCLFQRNLNICYSEYMKNK